MKERDLYLDIVKGIGIFLVVLGHHSTIFTEYIYSFHMPLFFFVAGIFHKNYNCYKEFLIKKVKALVIPYLFFSTTLFFFWLIIGRKFGESALKNTPIKESFFGIFLGTAIDKVSSMEWGVPVWFLICLFIVSNLYYILSFLKEYQIFLVNLICITLGFHFMKLNYSFFTIWHFLTALFAIPFYSVGNFSKNMILNDKKNYSIWVVILSGILSLIFSIANGRVDMNGNSYGNIFLFYSSAFCGILFILSLVRKLNIENKCISFIGKNTLVILAYHGRAMTFIKFILILLLGIDLVEDNTTLNIIFSFLQLIICLPVIYILNKFFPIFVGKK